MLPRRRDSLTRAVDAVAAGLGVEVSGSRGSGRTRFLAELADLLDGEGWNTLSIRGTASVQDFPLAALTLPGAICAEVGSRGNATIHQVSAAMRSMTASGKAVIVVDDWDDLDSASRGVIDWIGRAQEVPVVASRLTRAARASCVAEVGVSQAARAYAVEMLPFGIDEFRSALRNYLDGPIDPNLLREIFLNTAGHIGLTVALLDVLRLEDRLMPDAYGLWVCGGELWSPGLKSALEAQIAHLNMDERDCLKTIASIGPVDLDTAGGILDDTALKRLCGDGYLAVSSGPEPLVSVVPPLLGDYFRSEALPGRGYQIDEGLQGRQRGVELKRAQAGISQSSPDFRALDGLDAVFVGAAQEQRRERTLLASAQWASEPTPHNAVRYLRGLAASQPKGFEEIIEQVFAATDYASGDAEGLANLFALHASWLAFGKKDVAGALDLLRTEGPDLGVFGRLLDAAEVTILTEVVGIPENYPQKLRVAGDLPASVELALLEARLLVLAVSCRFSEARQVFERISSLAPLESRGRAGALYGVVLLGEGRHAEALGFLSECFEEAIGASELERARTIACALALCHSHSGDYGALDELANVMLVVGEGGSFTSLAHVSLLTVTTGVVAVRRGESAWIERIVAQARARELVDGPLPAQSLAWPISQLLVQQGRPKEAADALWDASEQLWGRGAHYAAMLGMLVAVEIRSDPARLAQLIGLLERIPENRAVQVQGAYAIARLDGDAEALLASAVELGRVGRYGLAVAACDEAEALFHGEESETGAHRARVLANELRFASGGSTLDANRFSSLSTVLTYREEQVARLAADGLANKDIALRLFVSVRTVESHMRRVMQKLEIASRDTLEEYFKGYDVVASNPGPTSTPGARSTAKRT